MYKIGICGNLGVEKESSNGQIIKTKIIKQELEKYFGSEQIIQVNTAIWKRQPIKVMFNSIKMGVTCRNIIIMPAQNGLKVFAPLYIVICKVFRKKMHYCVIGGWLPEYIKKNKYMIKWLKQIDCIYVETNSMKNQLLKLHFENIICMPNFKPITPLKKEEMMINHKPPYRICTFSRVKREKGILDIIEVVKQLNAKYKKKIYILDVYGQIEEDFEEEFNGVINENKEFVKYKGVVEFDKSKEIIKNYFALIFPTYYEGEGFPGTIIDAFSAGVPVIATNWKYNGEIISHKHTGLIYEIDNEKNMLLMNLLEESYINPANILEMKKNCLLEADKYNSDSVMQILIKEIVR